MHLTCAAARCLGATALLHVAGMQLRCLTPCAGLYNITAEYSGSSDGHYQPSSGYAPFKIGITTPPVQWRVAS